MKDAHDFNRQSVYFVKSDILGENEGSKSVATFGSLATKPRLLGQNVKPLKYFCDNFIGFRRTRFAAVEYPDSVKVVCCGFGEMKPQHLKTRTHSLRF